MFFTYVVEVVRQTSTQNIYNLIFFTMVPILNPIYNLDIENPFNQINRMRIRYKKRVSLNVQMLHK